MMNDMHDHGEATHSMNCPVCHTPLTVHAHDDEEAVGMLKEAGKKHFEEAGHPQDAAMTPDEIDKMTRASMKKTG